MASPFKVGDWVLYTGFINSRCSWLKNTTPVLVVKIDGERVWIRCLDGNSRAAKETVFKLAYAQKRW